MSFLEPITLVTEILPLTIFKKFNNIDPVELFNEIFIFHEIDILRVKYIFLRVKEFVSKILVLIPLIRIL